MGGAFGTVDDAIFFLNSAVVMLGIRRCGCGTDGDAKLSRRVKEARRVAILVYWLLEKRCIKDRKSVV